MKQGRNWFTEVWDDFYITARFVKLNKASSCEYIFELYEIVKTTGKYFEERRYQREMSIIDGDYSEKGLEDAKLYLAGFINYDGPSHFYFGENGHIKFSDVNKIDRFQKVLQKLVSMKEKLKTECI